MTTITLFTGGGVSLTPIYAEGRIEADFVRLVADDGKHLERGNNMAVCVDVPKPEVAEWREVDGDIVSEPEPEPDHVPAWDVTQAEYIHEGDRVSRDGITYRCISGHYAAWSKQPPNDEYWKEETE